MADAVGTSCPSKYNPKKITDESEKLPSASSWAMLSSEGSDFPGAELSKREARITVPEKYPR